MYRTDGTFGREGTEKHNKWNEWENPNGIECSSILIIFFTITHTNNTHTQYTPPANH